MKYLTKVASKSFHSLHRKNSKSAKVWEELDGMNSELLSIQKYNELWINFEKKKIAGELRLSLFEGLCKKHVPEWSSSFFGHKFYSWRHGEISPLYIHTISRIFTTFILLLDNVNEVDVQPFIKAEYHLQTMGFWLCLVEWCTIKIVLTTIP